MADRDDVTSQRKRRRLIDDDPADRARVEAYERRTTPSRLPQPKKSVSTLAPPSSTVTPARRTRAEATTGTRGGGGGLATPLRATNASGTSLLRSALRHGPATFGTTNRPEAGDSSPKGGLRRLPEMPFTPQQPRPAFERAETPTSALKRMTIPLPIRPRAIEEDDAPSGKSPPAPPDFSTTLPPSKQAKEVKGAVRSLSDIKPSLETDKSQEMSPLDLASPRKRKGGGFLTNGLARAATEALQRARTDHTLWQHALARRLTSTLEAIKKEEVDGDHAAWLRRVIEPDIRLRILSVLPGLTSNGPRLLARCAILSDEEEDETKLDEGTVVFSLATLQASSASSNAAPPPPPALLPSRRRSKKEARGDSVKPTLTGVSSPADLLGLLRPGVEVWVFEPWTGVAHGSEPAHKEESQGESIAWAEGEAKVEEVGEPRRSLVCTRFAVLIHV